MNDYYTAMIRQRIQHLRTGEMEVSKTFNPVPAYLALLGNLPKNDTRSFFIRHDDSRDANFLVDEHYNITGIIDWELAHVTSKASAFQPPVLMCDVGDIYDEMSSSVAPLDEVRFGNAVKRMSPELDLAGLAVQKLHFRLEMVLGADPYDAAGFIILFTGCWKFANSPSDFTWETWHQGMCIKYSSGEQCYLGRLASI